MPTNANYLPVLLVSVANAAPDDSFVSTRPRGQVDYLSHEWQEEDVWRSWRNMTRQKNEIANGVRLENASWRTWWKQRNKLKTVTPETLNWLKDSDVTWLYGPLHTASDDRPLLKPPGICEDFPSRATHKPILKYRSITELLTSDLPNSPVFSPHESESEDDEPPLHPPTGVFSAGTSLPAQGAFPRRPMLQHTKSDTHITRWGPNRAFRKDSPPRIEPPGHNNTPDSFFPKVSAGGPVRTSLSQDSNSSAGNSTSGERTAKKRHITFNTFVEQVIAIDQPKRSASFYGSEKAWDARRTYDDDDGYEEDQEDSAEEEAEIEDPWGAQRIRSTGIHGYLPEDYDGEEEEDENGIIELRASFRHATPKNGPRSQSKASNASSSSSVSTASSTTTNSTANSSSPSRDSASLSSNTTARRRPLNRRTSSSTYRPHLIRSPSEHVHVTIAPIAPTVLKTTELWEEGFGDDSISDDGFGWRERLWGYNDKSKGKARSRRARDNEDSQASDASGTSVELVYVPPFNSRYSHGYAEDDEEEEVDEVVYGSARVFEDDGLEDDDYTSSILRPRSIYHHPDVEDATSDVYLHKETAAGSVGFEDYPQFVGSPSAGIAIPIPANADANIGTVNDRARMEYMGPSSKTPEVVSIPRLVVIGQGRQGNVDEEDETDFFGGEPDFGDEYMEQTTRVGRQGYGKERKDRFTVGGDERRSRSTSRTASSRSKSHSRTPSPILEATTSVVLPAAEPLRRSNSSLSPSAQLAPPPPTRGRSHQDILQGSSRSYSASSQPSSRGRSASRNSGPPSLESSTSPFGGMSPDGVGSRYGSATAYVGGGRLERERDKDRTGGERRGREGRGRDRTTTDKRLSVSVSSSPEPPRASRRESSSVTTTTTSSTEAGLNSEASSTSSSKTIIPEEQREMSEEDGHMEAADTLRRIHPTPSNSPDIQMRAPPPSVASGQTTPTAVAPASMETPTKTNGSHGHASPTSPTPTKARVPPPLVPSPPFPALPSTSYTAVSSPSSASPRGAVVPPHIMTNAGEGTGTTSGGGGNGTRHRSVDSDSSIIGKASEIVNHAGAFFGLWNHSSASS